MKKILIAGESWMSFTTHVKGFDTFVTSTYAEGISYIRNAFTKNGFDVNFIPNHLAPTEFPYTCSELEEYDVVILSDIGSNTLLLTDNVFVHGNRESNRLNEIRKYVKNGGGFVMIGGYMSFTGIDAKTRYGETAIADILPVDLLKYDDRSEHPEGIYPEILMNDHPVFDGISSEWPFFLGYNKTEIKPDSDKIENLATIGGDPFITVNEFGNGRVAIFTSDCAPHWGPKEFVEWEYYDKFWSNLINWVIKRS